MFASQVKKTIEFEDGSVIIRKLSWRTLERARQARSGEMAAAARSYGGDVIKALRSETLDELAKKVAEKRADPEERRKARYAEYDRGTLLVAGIESWPYGELNPERIDLLDEEQAERLHQELVDLSLGPLEVAEAEALGKGAAVAST